jgi:hypothetical protein
MYGTVSSVNYRNNLIALDSSGNTLWSKYTENANQTNGQPGSVCAYNGYVYTVGVDNNGYTVVTKLNSSGALQWQALETDASNWDNSTPYGCVDSNGDVYVSGSWNASNYVYRIIKLSGVDGTVVWARTIGDTLNYSIYNGYNDTVQNTTAVGTEIFASFYGYDTNNSNNVAISVKLPADGSGLGTYGRWIYAADSAEFSDNTSNAAIISNTLGTPTDQTTQSGSSYNVSVGSDIGGYTANIIETISAGGTNIIFSDGSTQSTAFTGSTAILENGTSNVTIPTANGNVLFSLNDGGMSWNFSTDGYIYSKENYNFTTVAVDNGSYNNVNQRVVTPGGSDYASTQLSRNNFNIYLDQQGSYYQWSFNNDRLYTPQTTTGKIQAYNNAVQVQSMMAGNASAVASLQSISNSNDPNVLTSIDATTTGANIVVWNGGSVGGTANTWTFNNLGSLTVPGPVVGKANSTLTLKGSAPAVTGQFATATTAGGGYGGAGGTLALFQSGNFNSGSLSSVQAGNVVVESNGHTANIVTVTPNYASTGYTAIILDSAWSQSPPFTFYAGFGPSGNVKVQIDSNNWIFDNAGNLTAAGNVIASNFYPSGVVSAAGNVRGGNINTAGAVSATGNIYAANLGNISSINLNGNSSQVLYGNGVFSTVTSGYGDSNVTTLLSSFGSNTISTTGNVSTGNAIVSGTSSNIIRRAFGLVAADTYVQLDDIKARVTSSTSQLSIILASGSWQGTGWTETFTSGSISVSSWVNLPLSSGYDFASGAMNSQGNGCRCVISDQTPTAKVYEITVVRSGTSGTQWNISIERLV